MKSKDLYTKLTGMGYTVTAAIDGDSVGIDKIVENYDLDNSDEEIQFTLVGKKSKKEFLTIGLKLQEMPYCCGAIALGSYSITDDADLKAGRKRLFIEYVFTFIRDQYMQPSDELPTGKLLTFVSNGQDAWEEVDTILNKEMKGEFTPVSTHQNDDDEGNTLTMYIGKYN